MNEMENHFLFCDKTRNELVNVCLFLNYDEIKNLFLLNKSIFHFMKRFVKENWLFLKTIANRRFFDRQYAKIYQIDDMDHSFCWKANYNYRHSIYTDQLKNWKYKILNLDQGDIIWLYRINKFVVIQNTNEIFFLSDNFNDKMDSGLQFPMFYWKEIADIGPYRVWLNIVFSKNDKKCITYYKDDNNVTKLHSYCCD